MDANTIAILIALGLCAVSEYKTHQECEDLKRQLRNLGEDVW